MSGNSFGTLFKITTFGESHGAALGVVIDGVPAGLKIDREFLDAEMARRRPGQSKLATARQESDSVEILSGVLDDVTTGTALAMLIRNCDQHSKDYSALENVFRPGHADFGYFSKKDGLRHTWDLCEDCYDKLTQTFLIPIEETEKNELL